MKTGVLAVAVATTTLVLLGCAAPDQIPTLTATPYPASIDDHGQISAISIDAIDEKGLPGTGSVTFRAASGTLDTQTVTLVGGHAEARFSCPIATDPSCHGCVDVVADWTTAKHDRLVATAHLGVNADGTLSCAGGGGTTGGTTASNGGGAGGGGGSGGGTGGGSATCTTFASNGHKSSYGTVVGQLSVGDETQTDLQTGFDYLELVVNVGAGVPVPSTADLANESRFDFGLSIACPTSGAPGRAPTSGCASYWHGESGTLSVMTAAITTPGALRATGTNLVLRDLSGSGNCIKVGSVTINASW